MMGIHFIIATNISSGNSVRCKLKMEKYDCTNTYYEFKMNKHISHNDDLEIYLTFTDFFRASINCLKSPIFSLCICLFSSN